jgi:hypothetical protein
MTVAMRPASQRRLPSSPPAPRGRKPMSPQGRQCSFDHRACARPAYPRDRTRSPSSVPPRSMRATRPRPDTPDPHTILKSP